MPDSNNVSNDGIGLFFRLRQAREMMGISKSELARRIGVRPSAAIQWERENGTFPSTSHLIHIAIISNVSFDWLATGRGFARGQLETLSADSIAIDFFEENLLTLCRRLPQNARAPLIAFLKGLQDK